MFYLQYGCDVIQGYYLADDSFLLYSEFTNLAITERRILETSYLTTRFDEISHFTSQSYVSHLKKKLMIVTMFNSSQVNQNNICVVVLLTLITKPAWQNIACDQKLPDNYFICETQGRDVKATIYERHKHVCHTLHTYILGKCYWFQDDNDVSIAIINSTDIHYAFLSMFSAWSYGHARRDCILMQKDEVTKRENMYIMTFGLPQHFGKTWSIDFNNLTVINATLHVLGQARAVLYTYICNRILHFTCKDSTCILLSYVCDGVFDCPDNSDEDDSMCVDLDRQKNGCGDLHFQCKSGGCVHVTQHCDDWQHCADGSDELYCLHSHRSIADARSRFSYRNYLVKVYVL